MSPFAIAFDRYLRAEEALLRAEYDRITGFKPDSPQEAGGQPNKRAGVIR
jgi:hypothetical protein